jgi:hypothetical protein
MKALKTIVATAVIVFTLTTVATAGVQHFTKAQSAQTPGKTPVRYTVTLTAKQLAHLISDQSGSRVTPGQRRSGTHARRAHRRHDAAHQARHQAHSQHAYRSGSSGQGVSSGQSGSHHYEPSHYMYASGNGHSGDCGDGGGRCGD